MKKIGLSLISLGLIGILGCKAPSFKSMTENADLSYRTYSDKFFSTNEAEVISFAAKHQLDSWEIYQGNKRVGFYAAGHLYEPLPKVGDVLRAYEVSNVPTAFDNNPYNGPKLTRSERAVKLRK